MEEEKTAQKTSGLTKKGIGGKERSKTNSLWKYQTSFVKNLKWDPRNKHCKPKP